MRKNSVTAPRTLRVLDGGIFSFCREGEPELVLEDGEETRFHNWKPLGFLREPSVEISVRVPSVAADSNRSVLHSAGVKVRLSIDGLLRVEDADFPNSLFVFRLPYSRELS